MRKVLCCLLILCTVRCRQHYDLPLSRNVAGLLVVEGSITFGGSTNICLSHISPLVTREIVPEKAATVQVEGDDHSLYVLSEKDSGWYAANALPLIISTHYRLLIHTQGGKSYASDFAAIRITPPLDSISWQRNNGVQMFIHSDHPENDTRLYKWQTEETWRFHSHDEARLYIRYDTPANGIRQPVGIGKFQEPYATKRSEDLFTCYKTVRSSSVLLGNTTGLSSNVVLEAIRSYPENAWQLNDLYSITVRQFGLDEAEYAFYSKLKKNTESLGSIFDAQPSEIRGNVHCLSDPSEQVIGYVGAGTVEEKTLFISVQQLPGWFYNDDGCGPMQTFANTIDDLNLLLTKDFVPSEALTFDTIPPHPVITFLAGPRECIDCRTRGSSRKPDFWP